MIWVRIVLESSFWYYKILTTTRKPHSWRMSLAVAEVYRIHDESSRTSDKTYLHLSERKKKRLVEGREKGKPAPCLVDLKRQIPEWEEDENNENNSKHNMEEKEDWRGSTKEQIDKTSYDWQLDNSAYILWINPEPTRNNSCYWTNCRPNTNNFP